MKKIYSKILKILFWKARETRWIICAASVIIVMVSMVFSVSQCVADAYKQALADTTLPFDLIVSCDGEEEIERITEISSQYGENTIMISTGNIVFSIPDSNFFLNTLAASDNIEEMYNIKLVGGRLPCNTREIAIDNKLNDILNKNYQAGDKILLDYYIEGQKIPKKYEYEVVGFLEVPHGSGFELYGYVNDEAGVALTEELGLEQGIDVFIRFPQASYEIIVEAADTIYGEFGDRMSVNSSKISIMFDNQSSTSFTDVFTNLGYIMVIISTILFSGILRLNLLNVKKRIGFLRCMGLKRKQMIIAFCINIVHYIFFFTLFSLPFYLLSSYLFGNKFFQNVLHGYANIFEVDVVWRFSMVPYIYSLLSVCVVCVFIYGVLFYNVISSNPLDLLKETDKVKPSTGKKKKEKKAIALMGRRNLVRSRSRTFVMSIVFFLMSSLLLLSIIVTTTVDFTSMKALRRGQKFSYEFYTSYQDTWIGEECMERIKQLPDVECLYGGRKSSIDYYVTEKVKDVEQERVGIISYSDELLDMTCKENGIKYEMGQQKPCYYIYTLQEDECEAVTIWDREGVKKEIPISGVISDATYSYYKVGEEGFGLITNELGAQELFGDIKYNFFFVKVKNGTDTLGQIRNELSNNEDEVYYNDLQEVNRAAIDELYSILFMVAYIAVCIGFMVVVNIVCNIIINIVTRKRELGLLAAMGMRKDKIIKLLIYEITAILDNVIIYSFLVSVGLSVFFEIGIGQECDYVKIIVVAIICMLAIYMICYLICYLVGHILLRQEITKVLYEE